jgi:hypothetical protein
MLRLVEFHRVDEFLRQGWMVVPPNRPHPVIDVRSVLMLKLCSCEVAS